VLGLDQAAADGVAGELDAVAHSELLEDVLAVSLDRFHADHELLRDLLRGVGLGDQLQYLQLARGEDVELFLVGAAALDEVFDSATSAGARHLWRGFRCATSTSSTS
jgi:hypothetical protein